MLGPLLARRPPPPALFRLDRHASDILPGRYIIGNVAETDGMGKGRASRKAQTLAEPGMKDPVYSASMMLHEH